MRQQKVYYDSYSLHLINTIFTQNTIINRGSAFELLTELQVEIDVPKGPT